MISETYVEEEKKELKVSVRTSLRASSIDGSLSTVFSNITGGILLTSFLIDLGASPFEIGMVASLPMLANLLQPLGALLSNRSHSRHDYGIWTFLPSRLLWLILLIGIIQIGIAPMEHHATFFAIVSEIAGISSALGATVGGALAQYAHYEGIFGVFFLSAILRLVAIIPLLFVHEN